LRSDILPNAHFLVIDDEEANLRLVRKFLQHAGYHSIATLSNATSLEEELAARPPDLVILDLNLPVLDGLEVCRILRGRPDTAGVPIIMLTARSAERDRITGLDLGADDYITKPFSLNELAARVRAVLRRRHLPVPASGYKGKHLTADFEAVSIKVDGASVRLTRREFELLRFLVQNRNRVVSRDRLLERVWGYENSLETRSVDVHVGRLRQKLGPVANQIETVIGLGYRFVDEP
jgi:DNA-binding response OmpR family regulator